MGMDNSVMTHVRSDIADPVQSLRNCEELCNAKTQRFRGSKRFASSNGKSSSKLALESLQTHNLSRWNSGLYDIGCEELALMNSAIETNILRIQNPLHFQ